MIGCLFNIDGGYLEGLCRGFKCGILRQADYLNLVQCETLEGEKIRAIVGMLSRLTNFY
jgi:V-type H+-transporting ATPase subunit d